jgi:predicted DNA-binding transcriptional regulator YafY
MLETSARLLRLLSLLQTRRDWSGAELAGRLEVDVRTVRRDVDKLRTLGYPVNATTGTAGGYRLGAGASLPPLLLDDEEAVAVAVGLRTAARGAVAGIEETSVRALAKLEQVLPSRLRHRVNALQTYTVAIPGGTGPTVDPAVLTVIASTCRDHERLRFDYRKHDGTESVRTVEPHRLVCWGKRWYLVAWDVERDHMRTYRVDRIRPRTPTGPRFTPRDLPDEQIAEYVERGVSEAGWRHRGRIRLHAPAEQILARINPSVGVVEVVDEQTCVLSTGSDSLEMMAIWISALGCDFEVESPPELVGHIEELAGRYARAAVSSSSETPRGSE